MKEKLTGEEVAVANKELEVKIAELTKELETSKD